MSKFHKTFKENFILNEWYIVEKYLSNKVECQYVKFERGHLQFITNQRVNLNVSGGEIRDEKAKISKNNEIFTVNGWIKI